MLNCRLLTERKAERFEYAETQALKGIHFINEKPKLTAEKKAR
jgi:hypothetical protein